VCERRFGITGRSARHYNQDVAGEQERGAVPGEKRRVLVVEDDARISELVTLHLQLEGLAPTAVADGNEALARARAEKFDLIVLDLMLPGLDGLTVCSALRRDSANVDVPVLMLTARDEESDKVLGLESGADDYLTKPFGVREFIARVRALLRRPPLSRTTPGADARPATPRPVMVAGLSIDPARRQARLNGAEIELTALEFDLLYLLASNRGIVFSREALVARVWGGNTYVTERNVDTIIKRLRRKLDDDAAHPRLLLTIWSAGYKFADA
jgi:DNA-binding response OmpR family regulator